MVFRILFLSFVTFLAVWPVIRFELPAVMGPVWASGASERWSVKILLPLLFVGALVCAAWGVPVGPLPGFYMAVGIAEIGAAFVPGGNICLFRLRPYSGRPFTVSTISIAVT